MKEPKSRAYIILCRKFEEANASVCPVCGQIAINNAFLANLIYRRLSRWSYRYYGTIAVSLFKRNSNGETYSAIKR